MTTILDLIFRARIALRLDRGGIEWGDDELPSSAALWADFDRAEAAA